MPTTERFLVIGATGAVLDAFCDLIGRQPGWEALRVVPGEPGGEVPGPGSRPASMIVTTPDDLAHALELDSRAAGGRRTATPVALIGTSRDSATVLGLDRHTVVLDHRDRPATLLDNLRAVLEGAPIARPGPRDVPAPARVLGLTPRQVEVMGLLAQGMSHSEIAEALSLSPHTLRTHMQNLMARTGLRSRAELVAVGIREGLADFRRAG